MNAEDNAGYTDSQVPGITDDSPREQGLSLAFVSLNALPAIEPACSGPIGGVETRSWAFARGLVPLGNQVTLIVRSTSPLEKTCYEGVTVQALVDRMFPIWHAIGHSLERTTTFPGIRLKSWNAHLLWQLPVALLDRLIRGKRRTPETPDPRLRQLAPNCDLYATFGVQSFSATVIATAHALGKPAVLFLGSDGDLLPMFEQPAQTRDPYGTTAAAGHFILNQADAIVAQTPKQQTILKERFHREALVIRNPIDVAEWDRNQDATCHPWVPAGWAPYVLWIGRAEEVHKQPGICLELARRCPDVRFLMILNRRDPQVEQSIRESAPENVHIVEQVPFPRMSAIFHHASVLVNTSQLEGFPNVFLQAAISGVPVGSLQVGASYLSAARAGRCCAGSLEYLADFVRRVSQGASLSEFDAAAARRFVIEQHSLEGRSQELNDLLHRTLSRFHAPDRES